MGRIRLCGSATGAAARSGLSAVSLAPPGLWLGGVFFEAPSQSCPMRKTSGVWGQRPHAVAREKHYRQLHHRHGAPFVRHLLSLFRNEEIAAPEAARQLSLSPRRFYQLYSDYLRACAGVSSSTGCRGFRAATIKRPCHSPSPRCSPSSSPPNHPSPTASPQAKSTAAPLTASTAPPSGAGPWPTACRTQSRSCVPRHPSNAGSANAWANSGNWMPRLTRGSPAPSTNTPCSISSMTARAS